MVCEPPLVATAPSTSSLRIGPARPSDFAGIADLYEQTFVVAQRSSPRPAAVWDWLYRRAPNGVFASVAVDPQGRVLAHFAAIPLRAHVGARECTFALGLDSMVHPSARSGLAHGTLFVRTAESYFARFGRPDLCHATYGLPNRDALRIGRARLGYEVLAAPVVALFHNSCAQRQDERFDMRPLAARRIVPVARYSPEADELWAELAAEPGCGLVRDQRYLNWRFADAPLPYRCLEVRNRDRLCGVAVLRENWCGAPILAIVELQAAADDRPTLAAVLRHAVAQAYVSRMHRVELWLPAHGRLAASARALGFAAEPSPATLCVRLHAPQPDLQWHREHWHYTIGDGDLF